MSLVKEVCSRSPRKKQIKVHESDLMVQRVNKKQYIKLFIENDNFESIKFYHPNFANSNFYDQMFVFVLIIHISSSPDGHVHDLEMNKILLLLGKLQSFGISPSFICADGETGLSKYHYEYFKKYIEPKVDLILTGQMTIAEFIESIFADFPNCPPMPLLDCLHGCKTARTRLIRGNVFLDLLIDPILHDEMKLILDLGPTIDDMSNIGKMKDYYAINLFSFENFFKAYESGSPELATYILVYTSFLESFRNPIITMNTRKKLCDMTILFFFKFYEQAFIIAQKGSPITQNKSKKSEGINFASQKFLIQIIHSIVALRFCLDYHYNYLSIDRLTTHIIENFFGQNRSRSKGNNTFGYVIHFFIKGALDFQIVQQYNLGDKINERDNLEGTRYDEDNWVVEFQHEIDPLDFVNAMFDYGTQKTKRESDILTFEQVDEYIQIFKAFYDELKRRNAYKSILSQLGNLSGQAIFYRYCSKMNNKK